MGDEELLEGVSKEVMNEEMCNEHEDMREETELYEELVEGTAKEMTNVETYDDGGELTCIREVTKGDEELAEVTLNSTDEELHDQGNEVIREATERDEDFVDGESNESQDGICDEEVLKSSVGALIHELEHKEIEIGDLQIENEILVQENQDLKEENLALKNQLLGLPTASLYTMNSFITSTNTEAAYRFGAHSLQNDDRKVLFYTGLPSCEVFDGLYHLLEPLVSKNLKNSRCSLADELLIVLMKLRLGVPNDDLGFRFNISRAAVSYIFHKWISIMSIELKCLVHWPDYEKLRQNMPSCFRKHYSNVRCIIDCFEIFIERPVVFEARAATYSNYKKGMATTPTGSISFISQAWGGRVSDKEITQKCGFLDKIEYGDDVMADRGFTIADDLAIRGAKVLIPAYTKGKSQLSKEEVETTRQLARVRIHVERIIGQLRKIYTRYFRMSYRLV